ncbi:sugar O-acyltransferase, sialic acid O-acetyltransferase NeuD family [Salinimicrobium sediminis]|uniref:Sugar O-acyltransferase, sialic acid O-acetyltransferase NeuD family n=1 Tax=Salinimicrobium sediminis TaxID=1343891 RepID=A0A285X4S0_9FLAO|nr:acetyltransferase [Salinimicrobium sediminis]SOC80315.1 sugar O-acyltransferase, sialic acid O-acetyltransferase NeuD family [Salinimicrobium sediminis]
MKKKKLVIYGVGRFAEYVQYVFDNDSEFETVAFCIEKAYLSLEHFGNKPLIPFEDIFVEYPPEKFSMFIAVGSNFIRQRIFTKTKELGYTLASYISSKSSHWENLLYGENVFVDEGCVLQPFTRIGENTILFTSQIGHHTSIGDHTLVSGSKTGGNVKIGDNCYVGLNASIKQNLNIADGTIIGMGCIIEKDISESSVYTHKGTTKRKIEPDQIARLFLK